MTDDTSIFSTLAEFGIETVPHTGSSLLAHLEGTQAILRRWGCRDTLCTAGLLHSVYGTESFKVAVLPLGMRERVREAVGPDAEALAYLFGAMVKDTFYANLGRSGDYWLRDRFSEEKHTLDEQQLTDLCVLTVANWLEQRPRVAEEHKFIANDKFRAMLPLLPGPVRDELSTAYGFDG